MNSIPENSILIKHIVGSVPSLRKSISRGLSVGTVALVFLRHIPFITPIYPVFRCHGCSLLQLQSFK